MFISRRQHATIVKLLEDRLADLRVERDFYRTAWTERLGLKFVSPSEVIGASSRSPEPEASADRPDANWSPDDRDIFFAWAETNAPADQNAFHVWRERYGEETPVRVAIAGGW